MILKKTSLITSLPALAALVAVFAGCSGVAAPETESILREPADSFPVQPDQRVSPEMVSLYMKSRIAMRHRDRWSAYRYLQTAVKIDGDNPVLQGDLATASLHVGRTGEAVVAARKSLENRPNSIGVNSTLARALDVECLRQGDNGPWQESLIVHEKLVELDPSNFPYRIRLGQIASQLQKWDTAEQSYLEAEKLANSPDHRLEIGLKLGWLKMRKGNFREAGDIFKQLHQDHPDHRDSWQAMIGVAMSLQATGNLEEAVDWLNRAHERNPGNNQIKGMLLTLHKKLGNLPEAVELAEELSAADPKNQKVKLELGMLNLEGKEYHRAEELFDELIGLNPDEAGYRYYRGLAVWRSGRMGEAEAEFKNTVRMAPDRIEGWIHLGYVLLDLGKHAEAADSLASALVGAENHFELLSLKCTAEFHLENFETAIEYGEAALKQRERHPPAMFYLAAAYERTGEFDKAVRLFRDLLEDNPNHHQAANYLSYMFSERGVNLQESLALIRRVVEAEPENGVYLDSLGWVYFKLGRLDDSLEALRKATEQNPDSLIYEHLGDVYMEKRMVKKAYEAYLKARTAGGDDQARIQEKVRQLLKSFSEQ
ncbi:tetratricopeptide repeat protein [candidate division KSB1 bacterium]